MAFGKEMYDLVERLFPICRSITGPGFLETLSILKEHLPEIKIHSVPSGTQCFDWTVPKEWKIHEAYIVDPHGEKIIDFQNNNLHVMGYSIPVNMELSLEELEPYLFSLPDQPTAIPYMVSYYKERWGFCLTHNQRLSLKPGKYKVVINSELFDGSLNYGEVYLPGETEKEVFLSTYACHPSMANHELSGPVVTIFLMNWLKSLPKRKYSYRAVIIPETIGSIVYLSQHYHELRQKVIAGFNVTCVGDDRTYSYLPTRLGNTLSDRVAKHVLGHIYPDYDAYDFRRRGGDERQYCSPGIDLPIASVMRSKYATFPEYHTSLDNMDFISPEGLQGGFDALQASLKCIEMNDFYQTQCLCEPQLGKRGLYQDIIFNDIADWIEHMMEVLAYSDGSHDLLSIADKLGVPLWELEPIVSKLLDQKLIQPI